MSDGEQGHSNRRRGRRRGRRATGPPQTRPTAENPTPEKPTTGAAGNTGEQAPKPRRPRSNRRGAGRLRSVHEISAGGLVVDNVDGPRDKQVAVLIGRTDRRGRMLWSLPKGHIEVNETAEQTAIREVAEETGIRGEVLASLGNIDYWFVTGSRRVHKTVHHYLMRFTGGELSDDDVEVAEVAWVPVGQLASRLAYADERRLAVVADELLDRLHAGGSAALPKLPPTTPRRRAQTHSRTRGRGRRRNRPAPGQKNGRGRES